MTCDAWPIIWPCSIDTEDEELVSAAASSAQSILWSLSGRRYGLCTVTESYRPTLTSSCGVPYKDLDGNWRNGVIDSHNCCHVALYQRPVRAIIEVKIQGEVLNPDSYALERDNLWRNGACFPSLVDCEEPPIEVTYMYGIDLPSIARLAMGEVACEILAGLSGGDCRLPSNAISVSRQGVTVDLGDAQTLFDQGRIGLPIADAFLRMANPNRLQSQSQVFSPDMARRVR